MKLLKDYNLRPDQVDEKGHIQDEALLKKERLRFSFLNLFWAEEGGLGAIPSLIIRRLGGDFFHIGLMNSFGQATSLLTFLGPLGLRYWGSYKKGVIYTNIMAVIQFGIMALAIIAGGVFIAPKFALYMFLGMVLFESMINGYGMSCGPAYTGDFVPRNKIVWFSSLRSIFSSTGGIFFSYIFGRVTDHWANSWAYGSLYMFFCVSTIVVIFILRGAPDPKPELKKFFTSNKSEKVRYNSRIFWFFFAFMFLWSMGGGVVRGMGFLYLIDKFKFTNTQIGYLVSCQMIAGVIVVFILGKIGDVKGNRPLLILACFLCLFSGLLNIASAWVGLSAALLSVAIGAIAGNAHWFLWRTLQIKLFPHKGMAAYFTLFQIPMGIIGILMSLYGGIFMEHMKGRTIELFGATLIHYHMLFAINIGIQLISIIPLATMGNKTMDEEQDEFDAKQAAIQG